jgi:hypothetical protein
MKEICESEKYPANNKKTKEEVECDYYFKGTAYFDGDNKVVVKMLLREGFQISDTRRVVYKRLKIMEAKREKNEKLRTEYDKYMREYLQRGEMQEIPKNQIFKKGVYYIPHHAFLRKASLTTKLRVVFDANCRGAMGSS